MGSGFSRRNVKKELSQSALWARAPTEDGWATDSSNEVEKLQSTPLVTCHKGSDGMLLLTVTSNEQDDQPVLSPPNLSLPLITQVKNPEPESEPVPSDDEVTRCDSESSIEPPLEDKPSSPIRSPRSSTVLKIDVDPPVILGTKKPTPPKVLLPISDKPKPKPGKIDWTKGALIGTGSFGKVYRGLDNVTGRSLAVKEVLITSPQILKDLKKEIEVLKTVEHRNIVKYLGLERVKQAAYILMEYVPGGTLASTIKMYKTLREPVACNYTREILDGVAYLHSYGMGIVHRDIKGANILITPDGHIKLVDFGSAKSMVATEHSNSIREGDAPFRTVRGTPFWMAPEVIRESGHGPPADIWSLGCTILEMLTGKPPYNDLGQLKAMHAIASGTGAPPFGLKEGSVSHECLAVLAACLQREPEKRPKAHQLQTHPWIMKDWSPSEPVGQPQFHRRKERALREQVQPPPPPGEPPALPPDEPPTPPPELPEPSLTPAETPPQSDTAADIQDLMSHTPMPPKAPADRGKQDMVIRYRVPGKKKTSKSKNPAKDMAPLPWRYASPSKQAITEEQDKETRKQIEQLASAEAEGDEQ
eukprot:TRINITY_DN21525_c0_g1_i1.p1 TRINITY_DN21525_c0_g1~~TRINITY_DN21525_c0_g1_i1.p1  ORF type:complete len:588 (+),score=100.58 TRINITY_DN21525_c0_g1_i1:42-1805(+)